MLGWVKGFNVLNNEQDLSTFIAVIKGGLITSNDIDAEVIKELLMEVDAAEKDVDECSKYNVSEFTMRNLYFVSAKRRFINTLEKMIPLFQD